VITLDQLRRGLGLTRAEWRDLQYAAIDREMSTRQLVRAIVRTAMGGGFGFSIRAEPVSIRQSQSTSSPERGSIHGTSGDRSKASRCT